MLSHHESLFDSCVWEVPDLVHDSLRLKRELTLGQGSSTQHSRAERAEDAGQSLERSPGNSGGEIP
jgi:hypothetical protein